MTLLDTVENILAERPFTKDEVDKYKVHKLHGDWEGYMGLHLQHRNSDWVLVYKISGNSIKFEDTFVELERTGTHDECYGYETFGTDLIYI